MALRSRTVVRNSRLLKPTIEKISSKNDEMSEKHINRRTIYRLDCHCMKMVQTISPVLCISYLIMPVSRSFPECEARLQNVYIKSRTNGMHDSGWRPRPLFQFSFNLRKQNGKNVLSAQPTCPWMKEGPDTHDLRPTFRINWAFFHFLLREGCQPPLL